ncbi:hypothetical protein [Corynebacterium glyciniphilum]|uniref:hypothetical protein n=1 Tax=Corynebacterium glyciniphilum TaxID=1404244 RepID=UPI002352F577
MADDDETRVAAEFRVEMQRIAVPPPEPAPASHRTLPVEIATWMIEDDWFPVPDLGDTIELPLLFSEVTSVGGECACDDVVTVDAWADEDASLPGGVDRGAGPRWPTILRGDGWTAEWSASRPVAGHVRVTGRLRYEPDIFGTGRFPPTRGAVRRIRLCGDGEEVDVAGLRPPFPASWSGGVRRRVWRAHVILDLDDATAPQPRESRPGWQRGFAVSPATSVDGRESTVALWRLDDELPVLWRVDPAGGTSDSVPLPVKIGDIQTRLPGVLTAHNGGCQVSLTGGRRLLVTGGGPGSEVQVNEVADPPALREDPEGGKRPQEVVVAPESWGGWVVGRYGPTQARLPETPVSAYTGPVRTGVLELGRVSAQGDITWITPHEISGPSACPGVLATDDVVMTWKDNALQYLDRNLQVTGEGHLPDDICSENMEFATAGPWLAVQSLHVATSQAGEVTKDRRLYLLDPLTMEAEFSAPCTWQVQVQADGRDTVWLADGDLRCVTCDGDGGWTARTVWREQESTE